MTQEGYGHDMAGMQERGETATEETVVDAFMHALQELERTKDPELLARLFDESAELGRFGHADLVHGRDGARKFWNAYLEQFDTVHSDFTYITEGDTDATLEWTSEGKTRDGRQFRYTGVSILEFENCQISRFRTYYDSAALPGRGRA
jgi:hypothetical protein